MMDAHSFSVEWRFVVPPANTKRIVIMQRRDGPFRKDTVGKSGHYYVSLEELAGSRWVHVEGSASGGFSGYAEAHTEAERHWNKLATLGVAAAPAPGLSKRVADAVAALATHYDDLPHAALRDAVKRLFQMVRDDLVADGVVEADECGTCRKALPTGCNTEFQGEQSCALTHGVALPREGQP